jgi:hypothetical protein
VCLSFIEESVGLPSQEIVCLSFIEESVGLPSQEIVCLSFIEESGLFNKTKTHNFLAW